MCGLVELEAMGVCRTGAALHFQLTRHFRIVQLDPNERVYHWMGDIANRKCSPRSAVKTTLQNEQSVHISFVFHLFHEE